MSDLIRVKVITTEVYEAYVDVDQAFIEDWGGPGGPPPDEDMWRHQVRSQQERQGRGQLFLGEMIGRTSALELAQKLCSTYGRTDHNTDDHDAVWGWDSKKRQYTTTDPEGWRSSFDHD